MIRLLFLFLLCAPAVSAGPWLRTPGTVFSAVTTEIAPPKPTAFAPDLPVEFYSSVYAEYGLTHRITIGLDGGADGFGNGQALAFIRLPLSESDYGRTAAELGVGARWSLTGITPILRPGLSWGRGLSLFGRPGWTSFDATLTIPTQGAQPIPKLDAMIGLDAGKRMKLMLGLSLERPAPTLSPSIAYRLSKTFHVTLGLKLRGDKTRPHAMSIGFWQEF